MSNFTASPKFAFLQGRYTVIRGERRILYLILSLALLLRLFYGLAQDHLVVYTDPGGDSGWYLANGYALATGFDNGYLARPDGTQFPIILRNLPTPPVYLLFLGFWQALLPAEAAIVIIRLLQALMGTLTCCFAYRLGRTLSADTRVGLIAAAVLAISPVFVMETAQIATETLYLFLLTGALVIYIDAAGTNVEAKRASPLQATPLQYRLQQKMIFAGILLGLATLTRAVLLLFPLGLALHLLLVYGWRRGLQLAGALLLAYGLVVASWTFYNLARWERLVIAGEGLAAFLYVGATPEGWQGGEAVDESLPAETGDHRDQAFTEGAQAIISSDPVGYIRRRVNELAEALFQPHGTLLFSGTSLRELTANWLHEDRTISGLITLAQSEAFWPKFALYAFHFVGLIGGLLGMWLSRGRWQAALPLAGFILYTLLIHLVLTALPRYLFPLEFCWWVFASAALVWVWDKVRHQ